MRRPLALFWMVIFTLAWMGCEEDGPGPLPDGNGGPPPVDLSSFIGCWLLRSTPGDERFGPEVCRAALDSVLERFRISAADSFFTPIDTVTHLTFIAPYRENGDFAGTEIRGDKGSVNAVYHHDAGACSLATTISGDLLGMNEGSEFQAFYTVKVHFEGRDSCLTGDCAGFVTFEGLRRPESRCESP